MKPHVILIISAVTFMLPACSGKQGNNTAITIPTVDVTYPATDSVTLYRNYPGYLAANLEVELVARVDGYLIASDYKAGDIVRKGQILFRIEDTRYRDAVRQAQAQLETARSSYSYSSSQYEAMKKALESDAVSLMDVIQAESSMLEAQASIKNAEALLQTALTNLGYCTVRAPFTGHISASEVDAGTYLNGEASPVTLARLYDDSTVNAYIAIEDNIYMRMFASTGTRDGIDYTRVPVKFNEQLPHSYTGDLNYLSPEIDKETGTMRVRARINNPYGELRSGMYVTVALPYATVPDAILVRDASVGNGQAGRYMYTVSDSDKIVYTPITAGELVHDTMRIVNSGISPQSRYVTKALLKVRDGMTVKPVLTK
ncbi:MAG: efflux RND transporter periplasmic adaptor subunit [Muribaculaceae bacterium]|nr:efflux RND transporter periplasmic adaptor subunit [Muribaculaceae bacterium]